MDILAVALGAAFLLLLFWGVGVAARHYRLEEQPIRFSRMVSNPVLSMRRICVSEIAIHRPTAARLCMKCTSKQECDDWLGAGAGGGEPPEFCANKSYLRLARRTAETPY